MAPEIAVVVPSHRRPVRLRALLDALADQTAAALDRAALGREILSTRTTAATERVRNTLLASIS